MLSNLIHTLGIEIFTCTLAILVLLIGLLFPKTKDHNLGGMVTFIGLLVGLVLVVMVPAQPASGFFREFYVNDGIARYFKILFMGATLSVTLMAMFSLKSIRKNQSDFYVLLLFSLVGMLVMASATEFITLYTGLELLAVSSMILIAYKREYTKYSEAGLKYLLLNAVSSAIFLFGVSWLYGITGTLEFAGMSHQLHAVTSSPLLVPALVLVIAGLAFKITLVPFHMWAPDVYEGAPTPITAFLTFGSKIAGFAVFIRLFFLVFAALQPWFAILFTVLAVFTMVMGNLLAIGQTNIKRLAAYSGIAHAGYLMLGFIAYTQFGLSALLFYLLLYLVANAGLFAGIIAIIHQEHDWQIANFQGLWQRSPLTLIVIIVSLLSLAGIPPTAGFIGKFFLLTEVVRNGQIWLAFVTLAASLISIYYYLMVIRTMLKDRVDPLPEGEAMAITIPWSLKAVMLGSVALTLYLGVYPGPVLQVMQLLAAGFLHG